MTEEKGGIMKHYVKFMLLILFCSAVPVFADDVPPRGITLDGTVGSAGKRTLPGPNYEIKAEYGQQAGSNLFHSFHQFNIHSGESATFTGPDSVQNIITRVTGSGASWINGGLRSEIPGANLYLLNPAGVMFGPDASVNLAGAFHASTADYLRFGENEKFYTLPHENDVLSVAAPAAFGFLDSDIAPISLQGKGEITQEEGENPDFHSSLLTPHSSVSLIGGDIEITNGTYYHKPELDSDGNPRYQKARDECGFPLGTDIYVTDEEGNPIPATEPISLDDIDVPGGQISLISLASPGEVVPNASGEPDILSFEKMGDIALSGKVSLNVSGKGSGSVFIRGGRITVQNSFILANSLGDEDGGTVDIQGHSLSFTDGAQIIADTYGKGNSSKVVLKSSGPVALSGDDEEADLAYINTGIYTRSYSDEADSGDTAGIFIEGKDISFTDGALIDAETNGGGSGGEVRIRALESFFISGEDSKSYPSEIGLTTLSKEAGAGAASDLFIEAKTISAAEGAKIYTSTRGRGSGGDIELKASESVRVSGETCRTQQSMIQVRTSYKEDGAGDAGDIRIQAKNIEFKDGAYITSSSLGIGTGDGGDIELKASESVSFSGESTDTAPSNIMMTWTAGVSPNIGNSGSLLIEARNISFTGGANISGATAGEGRGGDVTLKASESVSFSGENSKAETGYINLKSERTGDSGNLLITGKNVSFTDGAEISTITQGSGRGGDAAIQALESVVFSGTGSAGTASKLTTSSLSTEADAGDAGNIIIETPGLSLREGAIIAANTEGAGDGGTVRIETSGTAEFSGVNLRGENEDGFGSGIYAFSKGEGKAGDIFLHAGSLSLTNGALITSSTLGPGQGGNLDIRADDAVNIAGDASEIPLKQPGASQSDFLAAFSPDIYNQSVSGIYAKSESREDSAGHGGTIEISAKNLNISERGKISTSSAGAGKAGDISIRAGEVRGDSGSGIMSENQAVNAYRFDSISERDQQMLVMGDVADIADTGGGKSGRYVYTGKNSVRVLPVHTVSDITELDSLSARYELLQGDAVKVADAGDGESAVFVYAENADYGLEEWIRIGDEPSLILDTISKSRYAFLNGTWRSPDKLLYAPGTVIRVNDVGDGKAATFVYSGRMERPDGSGSVWGQAVQLNNFTVSDMAELNALPRTESLKDGAVASISDADEGISLFVYEAGEWIKYNNPHACADFFDHNKLLRVQAGNWVMVENAGESQRFVYSGSEWFLAADSYTVGGMAERDDLSAQTGDTVHVMDAGEGLPERFLYADGEWIKFVRNGDAGTVSIVADDAIRLENDSLISTSSSGRGEAGDIMLEGAEISLDTGASVSSKSNSIYFGGDAGSVTFNAGNEIHLSGKSSLTTEAVNASRNEKTDGRIEIRAENLIELSDSGISSSVRGGAGSGGNISIGEPEFVILNHSSIRANAYEGKGGNIHIVADQFVRSSDSIVDASSLLGIDGPVDIESPDTDMSSGLTVMPENFLNTERWMKSLCSERSREKASSFILTGTNAAPAFFEDWWASPPADESDVPLQDSSFLTPYVNLSDLFGK
jgi:filamentous hemagglutinin family protein